MPKFISTHPRNLTKLQQLNQAVARHEKIWENIHYNPCPANPSHNYRRTSMYDHGVCELRAWTRKRMVWDEELNGEKQSLVLTLKVVRRDDNKKRKKKRGRRGRINARNQDATGHGEDEDEDDVLTITRKLRQTPIGAVNEAGIPHNDAEPEGQNPQVNIDSDRKEVETKEEEGEIQEACSGENEDESGVGIIQPQSLPDTGSDS
ncbi:hypothetical protein CBER1_03326 [Cercospora berteroae]|uniref:Uncharacterized protein n=1 Tax=Cercospora berteroae TaxID=357750 RepID=A0A2S6BQP9_9PEZI|nr:hypothetical protein CBER1_03326 [Cercospora berteroae]